MNYWQKIIGHRYSGIIALGVLFLYAFIIRFPARISHDPAWLLLTAERVLAGDTLYEDIVIFNLPMTIWSLYPAVWLHELTGLSAIASLKVYLFVLIAFILWLISRLASISELKHSNWLILATTFTILVLPAKEFAQREHFLVALLLPYLFSIAIRANGKKMPIAYWLPTALLAGVAVCLKPHFVLFPFGLELYLLAKTKGRSVLRPEPYVMIFLGLVYAGFIWKFMPNYLSKIIPYTAEIYHDGYLRKSSWKLAYNGLLIIMALISAAAYFISLSRKPQVNRSVFEVFLVSTIIAFSIFWIQQKGWDYHRYPAMAFSVILLTSAFCLQIRSKESGDIESGSHLGLVLNVLSAFLLAFMLFKPIHKPYYPDQHADQWADRMTQYSDATSFFVMSTKMSHIFPYVTESELDWGNRFPITWMSPSIIRMRDITDRKPYFEDVEFDYLTYFQSSEDFQAIWSEYEYIGPDGDYAVYRARKTTPSG